jgi:hypothetical protein
MAIQVTEKNSRKVFTLDVGNLSPQAAKKILEKAIREKELKKEQK